MAPPSIRLRPSLLFVALAAVGLLGAACSTDSAAKEAEDGSFDELDRIVGDVMEQTGVPGVALAVVAGDEVVYTQGYGIRSTESGEPVDPETVFQVASMSKPISSTIMSALVGDGVIDWDDPIAQYAPQFALSDPWVTEHVTFADLFAHRSGLPGDVAGNDLEAIGYERPDILERLAQVPLGPFRDQYSYSNWGMTLGGEAAAMAADSTWEDLSQELLFTPAGMESTSMRHEDYLARDNRADLHVETDGDWVPGSRQPDPQAPAGGVSSNVVDLAQWVRLQLAAGELDGTQIIDTDALDTTHTPMILKGAPAPTIGDPASFYGLGWNIGSDSGGLVNWNHSGAFSSGAATTVKMIPSEDVGIVVLTNGEPIGVPEAIADAYLEYLLEGEATTDWVSLWGERFGGLYGDPLELDTDGDGSPADPDEAYVGTYANTYAGEATVRTTDDGLELVMGPADMTFPLTHVDADTFTYLDAPELPEYPSTAIFVVDGTGNATSVTLSSLDGAGLGTLVRT